MSVSIGMDGMLAGIALRVWVAGRSTLSMTCAGMSDRTTRIWDWLPANPQVPLWYTSCDVRGPACGLWRVPTYMAERLPLPTCVNVRQPLGLWGLPSRRTTHAEWEAGL